MSPDKDTFQRFSDPVYKYINETVSPVSYTHLNTDKALKDDYNTNANYRRYNYRLNTDIDITKTTLLKLGVSGWLSKPQAIDLPSRLLSPDAQHWLGTDHLGRDIFSRLMAATRVSLGSVMACLLLVLTLGLIIGGSAGLIGGRVDQATMRVADMFMTFPTSILSFFMVGVLGTGLTNVIIAIALSHWAWYARMVRSLVISLRQREFVLASRLSGAGHVRVFVDHLAGAVIPSLLVLATLDQSHVRTEMQRI